MPDAEEIVRKFKKFAARSQTAYSEMYDRIREDRQFMGGNNHWTKDDDNFIEVTRNRITCNVLSNQTHSVANKYSTFPYVWYVGDADIDREIDDFFSEDSNRFATEEALLSTVSFGLGVMALGSDTTADGREVPVIYSIDDLERVMLDPDAESLDYSDAMETALIDYRSKEWIRVHMGEQYVPDKRSKPVFTGAFGKKDLIPIITYYYVDTDGCHSVTLVNDIAVTGTDEEGNESVEDSVLPIKRIPVFPVFGEATWNANDQKVYQGLIAKGKTVQRIVNYCMVALVDRLALSPKPQWRGYMESFKNYDKYYKDAGAGRNPIIPAQRLANDKQTQLPLPEPYQPKIEFADLQGIIDGTMNMMTSITGVDTKGLADNEGEITATAVMYTSQVFQNNVKHFFSHLRTSFKALGDVVMVLMGHAGQKISIAQGPEASMQNQIARAELTALMGVVEPNQKRAIVNAILKTHPDNEILAQLYADLNTMQAPTEMEMQAQQLLMQMKEAIEKKNEEIMSLSQQLEEYRRSNQNTIRSYEFELLKARQAHEFKMEELAVEKQLEAGADATKLAVEADKAQMEVEGKAIDLETKKLQANAEAQKAVLDSVKTQNELFNQLTGGMKNEAVTA